jgi:hypothetical protein
MARGGRAAVEVEGGPQLRRAFKRMEGRTEDLKDAHAAAGEIVAAEARTIVPVVSGRLMNDIRSSRAVGGASVLAGRSRVPYAGPIHFGWTARNIEPQPFLYEALDDRRDEVVERYEKEIASLVRKFDREAPR